MICDKRDYGKVRIVLEAAKQDLECSRSFVDRIVGLQKSARILKMLTDYQNLAEEIQRYLAIVENLDHFKISDYNKQIIERLTDRIQELQTASMDS